MIVKELEKNEKITLKIFKECTCGCERCEIVFKGLVKDVPAEYKEDKITGIAGDSIYIRYEKKELEGCCK
jgi:hypothetical protein